MNSALVRMLLADNDRDPFQTSLRIKEIFCLTNLENIRADRLDPGAHSARLGLNL